MSRVARAAYLHIYLRHIYRHHMRFIHRFGLHLFTKYGPMSPDGSVFYRCDWCGKYADSKEGT